MYFSFVDLDLLQTDKMKQSLKNLGKENQQNTWVICPWWRKKQWQWHLFINKLETALHSAFTSKAETAAAISHCPIVMIVLVI